MWVVLEGYSLFSRGGIFYDCRLGGSLSDGDWIITTHCNDRDYEHHNHYTGYHQVLFFR